MNPDSKAAAIWQRINLASLGCLVTFLYFRDQSIELTGLAALFLIFVPVRYSSRLLLVMSLLAMLILPRYLVLFFGLPSDANVFNTFRLTVPLGVHPLGYGAVPTILLNGLVFVLGFLCLRGATRWISGSLMFLFGSPVVIVLWLLWGHYAAALGTFKATVLAMTLALLSRSLISFSMYVRKPGEKFELKDLLWMQPFWILYLPCWAPQPIKEQTTNEEEQRQLFFEIALLGLGILGLRAFNQVIYGDSGFGNIYTVTGGLEHFFARGPGHVLELWVMLFHHSIGFIIDVLWAQTFVPYFFLRIMGAKVPAPIRNPFVANSFHEFFARLFVYYSRALLNLVCFPFYRWLGKIRMPQRMRKDLALALSVFVFAELFHSMRDYWIFLPIQGVDVVHMHLTNFSVYSALLTGAVMISVWIEGNRVKPLWLRIALAPVFLGIYSIILVFGNFHREAMAVKIQMVKYLFAIQ